MSADLIPQKLGVELDHLPDGAIVVGFSGGLDSTVLLHALAALPAARARGLRALHVDHRLHANSAAWAQHAVNVTEELRVELDVLVAGEIDATGAGLESAARKARYDRIAAALRGGEILALAHHADDQAETVLLKLLRGAGPEGLGGMRALRPFGGGLLWRPFLELPQSRLRAYAQAHGLRWIDDPSNADRRLRRNFLRAEIVPRLAQCWPDASIAIAHSARWSRAAAEFIGQQVPLALARIQSVDPATLAWAGWLDLPDALRDPALRRWLRALGFAEPAHFQVADIERQLRDAAEDAAPCVRFGNCELRRYRDLLYAMAPLPPADAAWQTEWKGHAIDLPGGGVLSWSPLGAAAGGSAAEYPRLLVRFRRGGERMRPHDSAHTRELRTLLQEHGIPPWQRERIPLVYEDEGLIAAGDLFMSSRARELCDRLQARIDWHEAAAARPGAA